MARFVTGLMLLALPVALVAQTPPAKPQTQTPAKPPTAASATTTFPTGTYAVTMSDGSVIEVKFADGGYVATQDGQQVAVGKYTTKGNQIVVSDNSDACASSGQGTYTWAFDGKALTFKSTQDACDTRSGIMNGFPFVKK